MSAHLSAGSPCAAPCAIGAERLRLWDRGPEIGPLAVCLSVMVPATWPWSLWDRLKIVSGPCLWESVGQHLLVTPGVLNPRAKPAAGTVLGEYITMDEVQRRRKASG